jgi:hypothetical protein
MNKKHGEIDLAQFGRDIYSNKDFPHVLDSINLELCSWYSYYSAQMIPLEIEEAKFWEEHKDIKAEKPKSDSYVRALWRMTVSGHKMIEYERVLKTLEKLMSGLRTSIGRSNQEARNQPNL